MSHVAKRKGGETYPSNGGAGGAAAGALRNRNVAVVPQALSAPFSPGVGAGTNVAAILFTPMVSGVIQVTALLAATNGATPDTYEAGVFVDIGTGLTVAGGAGSIISNGWVMGSTAPTAPPVVGGVISSTQVLGVAGIALAANGIGSIAVSAVISQPLSIGVPVVIRVPQNAVGGHSLAAFGIASLSVMELP